MNEKFRVVGILPEEPLPLAKKRWYEGKPLAAMAILAVIALGCLCCDLIAPVDPNYMDLTHCAAAPSGDYPFGTDTMGRDIFAMVWHGGRVSLTIGLLATALSTLMAILLGGLAGWAPEWLDEVLERVMEIVLSVPNLLLVVFLQAMLGGATVWSLSLVIGLTGWMSLAKVVRSEVRRLRQSGYVVAARSMGGGFFYILRRHLTPNFLSSIAFMVVMNLRSAIVAESTLSFMGLGLSLETVSWGSMLSLADKALLTGGWWILVIPGAFLIVTLLCVTELAELLRRR